MKLLRDFLCDNKWAALYLLLCTGLFAGVLALYDVPPEAALYAGGLCGAAGLGGLAVRFVQYRRRRQILRTVAADLPLMTDALPADGTAAEQQLCDMVRTLARMQQQTVTDMEQLHRDSLDYFTVWMHQIKTPIAAMQMLLQTEDTAEHRALLAELFRVEQYAEMALQYLRLDSPAADLCIRECDLDRILRRAVHRYAPQFIRRGIALRYEPLHTTVLTDEKWLLFIIGQLLSNAVKYTIKGSVTITCEDQLLTIADTGIGIAAEDLPRIFEKGYTGLSGRREQRSTGLGLYLCKRAADLLGTGLSVVSTIGAGTAFTLDLRRDPLEIE